MYLSVEATNQLIAVSTWTRSADPVFIDLGQQLPVEGLRWFDVAPAASAPELYELLAPICEGLEPEMIVDLLQPDHLPEGLRWNEGAIRLASTFAVYEPNDTARNPLTPCLTPSAEALYQPVELLGNEDWLITRWHSTATYCGSRQVEDGPPLDHGDVIAAVGKRWCEGQGGNAGDLGVMVMHELALTYASAHRRIYAALESWELDLYDPGHGGEHRQEPNPDELRDLWGARARLRDWINPLNVSGLRNDLDKAWLPATDHQMVIEVDDRVDKALEGLSQLGETLRSSFQMLHFQQAEAQRDRREQLQRRLERLAATFLIPTLIVGFYGANTWVPGDGRHWGFWVMVAAMVVLTAVGLTVIGFLHRVEDLRLSRLRALTARANRRTHRARR